MAAVPVAVVVAAAVRWWRRRRRVREFRHRRPGAGTAPRAPAKAEEPKPANGVDSAVTEGVNQLKKLLPF